MGAWIEIALMIISSIRRRSHPTMGAWIEIKSARDGYNSWIKSHPTMGAWIEISL